MARLKFFKMLLDKTIVEPFNSNSSFSHFVFQNTNADLPGRDKYGLVIYAYNNIPVLMPLDPKSLIQSQDHEPPPDFSKEILFGNFIMYHAQVSSVMIPDPAFKYLKFVAEEPTDPKFKDYLSYLVFPVDKDENPLKDEKLVLVTARINPSPPA